MMTEDTSANVILRLRINELEARIAELEGALGALMAEIDHDPSLQEQMVIAWFSEDDDDMPFAKAVRQARAAMAKAEDGE